MKIRAFTSMKYSSTRVAAAAVILFLLLAALPAERASASLPISINTIAVGSQSGTLTYGTGGDATFLITITSGNGANGDVPSGTLSVSGLPSGATSAFSPNPTDACTGDCFVTSTLTISTADSTPAVTAQSFTVHSDATTQTGSGALTVNRRAITVTAVADTKTYDGTNGSAAVPHITAGSLASGDTATWTQTFDSRNAGSGRTLTPTGSLDNGKGPNYNVQFAAVSTGVINKKPITVTAVAYTKTYDGTTSAAAAPTNSGVAAGDTPGFTEAYTDRNAGLGNKTLAASGIVNDNNGGNNYLYDYVSSTTGTINPKPITVTAVANSKTYDRTTSAAAKPTDTGVASGDTANFTEAYTDKTVGTNKTLTPSGSVSDTNSGNNYAVTLVSANTGTITAVGVTISGVSVTSRVYDGTMTAALGGTPVFTGVIGGDIATPGAMPSATFTDKNAGNNKPVTLTAPGFTLTGADAGNYTVTQPSGLTGTVTPKPITVTAAGDSKTYDGSNSSSAAPTITSGGLVSGDGATWTQTFDSRNAGSGKTLTPAGTISDGNSGNNYSVTFAVVSTGTISQKPITVTAVAYTKTYDGNTTAAALPTAPGIVAGDTPGFTEVYSDKNVGTSNKTLIPSGIVNDGNNGLNYTYTMTSVATGTISPKPITVTAVANSKTYDRTTSAAAIPTNSGVASGDTASFTEAYADKTVGTNKTLTPSGSVSDTNSGNNYAVTLVSANTGTITAVGVTISGVSVTSRVYDGTMTAALGGTPVFTGVIGGDIATPGATPSATFTDKNAGNNKPVTLTAPGFTLTGADAGNYTVTQPSGLTGTVTPKPITVTAIANSKVYDGTLTAAAIPTDLGVVAGDTPGFIEAYSNKSAGNGTKNLVPSGVVTDGNAGLNYAYTYLSFTTGTITQKPVTVTAITNTKTYDGNTTALAVPTNSGLGSGDTAGFTEVYSDKNVGTGNKTLIPSGLVADGNNGNNYLYTYVNFTAGTINARPITVRAASNTKTYDGTISSNGIPTITSGTLVVGENPVWTQTFDNKNVGTGKVLTPAGAVNDGNFGHNYNVTFATVSTGRINAAALTIKARDAFKQVGDALTFYGTEFTTAPATLYSGDWVSSVTLMSPGCVPEAEVGTYSIMPSAASGNGLTNYTISYHAGTLTVAAAPPVFLAAPLSWNYGMVKKGITSAAKTFTITNTGGSALIIDSAALAGANPGQFQITADTCSAATLSPGDPCSVTATFKPTVTGLMAASLQFSDNASDSPQSIPLSGKGAAELALNGGFNTYPSATSKIPKNWVAASFAATDGKYTAAKKEGLASLKIANTSAVTKTLTQTRLLSGAAGSTFKLSVWAKAQNIPATAGLVRVQVQLYNGTKLVQTKLINLPKGTYGFTQKNVGFTASGAYTKVVIKLIYTKKSGAVWFDCLSLLRTP